MKKYDISKKDLDDAFNAAVSGNTVNLSDTARLFKNENWLELKKNGHYVRELFEAYSYDVGKIKW